MTFDAETRAEFEALGVRIEMETDDSEGDDAFPVWDENWESVVAFLDLETQWSAVAGFSGLVWLGLNYVAADALLDRRFGRRRSRRGRARRIFEDLRVMEAAALQGFDETRDRP